MTATETAIRALVAVLAAASSVPTPRRNVALDDLASEAEQLDGSSILTALVVSDGTNLRHDRNLGDPPSWELTHRVELDWVAAGAPGDALEAAFDAGLAAIGDALAANPTLSGSVTLCECAAPPDRGLEVWGAKTAKTAMLEIELTYPSSRPF